MTLYGTKLKIHVYIPLYGEYNKAILNREATTMRNHIKDNPHMKVALDCKYAVTIHWDNNSYTVKVYTNKSGERYINLHGKRWYLS